MDERVNAPRGESASHVRLKRLALLWAQAHGYSACAVEVSLPHCRYRADLAAFRPATDGIGCTAIFECKQSRSDLRKDNRCSGAVRERLETLHKRRQILETHLRVHYPSLRIAESLFPEFDLHDFAAIRHKAYGRVLREMTALQNQLFDGTKFEKLMRYRCANLFFWSCLAGYFDRPKFRSAGVPWWNPMTASFSLANQSGRRLRRRAGFAPYSALPRLVRVN